MYKIISSWSWAKCSVEKNRAMQHLLTVFRSHLFEGKVERHTTQEVPQKMEVVRIELQIFFFAPFITLLSVPLNSALTTTQKTARDSEYFPRRYYFRKIWAKFYFKGIPIESKKMIKKPYCWCVRNLLQGMGLTDSTTGAERLQLWQIQKQSFQLRIHYTIIFLSVRSCLFLFL